MTFFNPKEEVLDIRLTQYGRHLLSKGKLHPTYYTFFDEGVIYDSMNAGSEENKNDAETRIQDETTTKKTQHCFTGRDEFLFDGVGDIKDRQELAIYERMFTLTDDLGTSQLGSTKAPYFSLTFLEGEIETSVNHQTGSARKTNIPLGSATFYSQQLLKIPQIEVNMNYKVSVYDPNKPTYKFKALPALSSNEVYANGLSVAVGPDDLMILVEEGNTLCDFENFDIEVFEMTEITGSLGEEIMTPLNFRKRPETIKNNILLDEKDVERAMPLTDLDSSFVEYYFSIRTDKEIGRSIICNSLQKFKKLGRNIYSPCGVEFDCPDVSDVIGYDIYASDASREKC